MTELALRIRPVSATKFIAPPPASVISSPEVQPAEGKTFCISCIVEKVELRMRARVKFCTLPIELGGATIPQVNKLSVGGQSGSGVVPGEYKNALALEKKEYNKTNTKKIVFVIIILFFILNISALIKLSQARVF